MKASTFVYPWDVNGDPDAAERIAGLGVRQATLASAYHSTRALTPRHPRRRIVTALHAAVLYPVDAGRWQGRRLRPYAAGDWAPGDAYGEAAAALAGAGLDVHTWVVLAHNSRMGEEFPDTSVVNAYGDRYPWAPCVAQPDMRVYLTDLAVEAAVRPGAAGTELESLGWYGLPHLHAHDKTAGVALGDAGTYLMSLCFCPSCRDGYVQLGLDPDELAASVRRALEPVWRGGGPDGGWEAVEKLLGGELATVTRTWRDSVARSLQTDVVGAVRAAAPEGFQILLHADPESYRVGANAGVDPEHILSVADGVVVPCAAGPEPLAPFAGHAAGGNVLAANFPVVSGMGGSPATLVEDVTRAAGLGATEVRLYHAGLASDEDLSLVARALERLG
ncbi:hypothetical protein O1Q96_12025 [Streptomyces sp. Qhu-G9]|uniref:hypothetical protein n=1 Tax=Streptomyces sp. Qhu-G9 TaxID=3452799 RepID=UPI0022AC6147|nr:hypothetical protein [Streptomyces aurantiacus]WAU80424.1 hypothetical protein O1Q96_12025 [Streptomyces aurantiacus]